MDVANIEVDVDEGDNKYQRRKNASGFLGKLIKAHEVHPKYAVSIRFLRVASLANFGSKIYGS